MSIFYVGIFIATLLLLWGGYQGYSTYKWLQSTEAVEGKLVEYVHQTAMSAQNRAQGDLSSQSVDRSTSLAKIAFITTSGEHQELLTNPSGTSYHKPINIRYNTENPSDAKRDDPVAIWIQTILILSASTIVTIATFILKPQ